MAPPERPGAVEPAEFSGMSRLDLDRALIDAERIMMPVVQTSTTG